MGGNYARYESQHFLLLSAETKTDSEAMLRIAENALRGLKTQLGALAGQRELCGKRVILAFNEPDDYYSYISYFYPDGDHGFSSGIFIKGGGYAHIALPFTKIAAVRLVLVHELTHNWLMQLKLPTWLNEGLCRRMEFSGIPQRVIVDREQAAEHHAYWNEQNIQGFWAGTSFYRPDEGNKLSYNLGEILVEKLSGNWDDFLNFVQSAGISDGGQDAALKCLNQCLGETLGGFLGPGQWRPNRRAMSDLWKKQTPDKDKDGASAKLL